MTNDHTNGVSRRAMLAGVGLGAGVIGLASATSAQVAQVATAATRRCSRPIPTRMPGR